MSPEAPELRLLVEQHRMLEQPRPRNAAVGTALAHVLLFTLLVLMPDSPPRRWDAPDVLANLTPPTPLIAPPAELTQRDPSEGKKRPEVDLSSLLSPPNVVQPPPADPGTLRAAAPKPVVERPVPPAPKPVAPEPKPQPVAPPPTPQPPVQAAEAPKPEPPKPEQPKIQQEERPLIAFETPGAAVAPRVATGPGAPRVPMPPPPGPPSVQELTRAPSRPPSSGGGISVGDIDGEDIGGLGAALDSPNAPTRQASGLELMSDAQGVDFRPYLAKILSTVRRNWLAVIPETARLGRRGRVQIQFAVARDGSVPKLVIATKSGTESLDRAAVAGISASNPFPPLPSEYKGLEVRLQFTFSYNMPSR